MSDNWYRRAKIGKDLTLSVGSSVGPTFSSSLGNKQMKTTIVNKPDFTVFRQVNKTGPYTNRTMVREDMLTFKEFVAEQANYIDPKKHLSKIGLDSRQTMINNHVSRAKTARQRGDSATAKWHEDLASAHKEPIKVIHHNTHGTVLADEHDRPAYINDVDAHNTLKNYKKAHLIKSDRSGYYHVGLKH